MALADTEVEKKQNVVPEKGPEGGSGTPIPLELISKLMGGFGSILGGLSSSKAGKSADEASRRQQESAIADLAFRQRMYDEAQAKYGPLEQQMLGMASSTEPLGYEKLSGEMQEQYADALRNLSQMGYQGGGLAGGAGRQAQFGLATGLGQAYNQGQMNRLNLGTSLLGKSPVYGLGQNISGGMQNMSNLYGQQAGMYGNIAAAGSQAIAQGLQGMAYGYGNQTQPQQQQPQSITPMGSTVQNVNSPTAWNTSNPFGNPTYPVFR